MARESAAAVLVALLSRPHLDAPNPTLWAVHRVLAGGSDTQKFAS